MDISKEYLSKLSDSKSLPTFFLHDHDVSIEKCQKQLKLIFCQTLKKKVPPCMVLSKLKKRKIHNDVNMKWKGWKI